jgi:taurine dioxygenase
MKVRKIAGALGAEISGIDLSQNLTDEIAKEIRNVFLDSGVIFIKNQALTSQQFLNFAKKWVNQLSIHLSKDWIAFLKSLR